MDQPREAEQQAFARRVLAVAAGAAAFYFLFGRTLIEEASFNDPTEQGEANTPSSGYEHPTQPSTTLEAVSGCEGPHDVGETASQDTVGALLDTNAAEIRQAIFRLCASEPQIGEPRVIDGFPCVPLGTQAELDGTFTVTAGCANLANEP